MSKYDTRSHCRSTRIEARLAEFGVASLRLFGSAGRGTARADSDIDLIVAFDSAATFDRYMGLKLYLEALLGRRVDLVTEESLRPELRPAIEREAIRDVVRNKLPELLAAMEAVEID